MQLGQYHLCWRRGSLLSSFWCRQHIFLDLWDQGVFYSKFTTFFFRSSWKYQVSSSFFHPLNHIALLNFSQKVRVNVKSPVFLFIPQNTWHSLYNSFVSRPFFFESECSMALKHGESTSLNEGNQKPKHISSHPSHQQKSRSLIILACYKRNLTNCLQMCSLWVCLAVI